MDNLTEFETFEDLPNKSLCIFVYRDNLEISYKEMETIEEQKAFINDSFRIYGRKIKIYYKEVNQE